MLLNAIARFLWLSGKKSRRRIAGSPTVGGWSEALFYGLLLFLGLIALGALVISVFFFPADSALSYRPGYGFWLLVLVLTSFILLGGGGAMWAILQTSVSHERRAALARKTHWRPPAEEGAAPPHACLPDQSDIVNSPGIKLRYRLPVASPQTRRLAGALAFCLLWNSGASVLVALAASSHFTDQPDWFLTCFTAPFAYIGIVAIRELIRQFLIYTALGPASVEISEHPLQPGGEYEVFLSQSGRLSMKSLALWLVCQERAAYHQGTDVRTETKEVFNQQICRFEAFKIEPGMPFEHRCQFTIPEQAMHSFQSENNAILWTLVLRGEAESWPAYSREFTFIVYPPLSPEADA